MPFFSLLCLVEVVTIIHQAHFTDLAVHKCSVDHPDWQVTESPTAHLMAVSGMYFYRPESDDEVQTLLASVPDIPELVRFHPSHASNLCSSRVAVFVCIFIALI